MQLIGVTGKARAGKDTVGWYLAEQHNYIRMALAGPLKEMARIGLGINPEEYQNDAEKETIIPWLGCSARHVWQTLGTQWMRECVNENGWLILAERAIDYHVKQGDSGVVITDVRFENEAAMVRRLGGAVVHVFRKDASQILSEQAQAHASEAGVAIGANDYVLHNNGSMSDLFIGCEQISRSLGALTRRLAEAI